MLKPPQSINHGHIPSPPSGSVQCSFVRKLEEPNRCELLTAWIGPEKLGGIKEGSRVTFKGEPGDFPWTVVSIGSYRHP